MTGTHEAPNRLGAYLQAAMHAGGHGRDITPADLAREAEMSASQISKYLSGTIKVPTLPQLQSLAQAIDELRAKRNLGPITPAGPTLARMLIALGYATTEQLDMKTVDETEVEILESDLPEDIKAQLLGIHDGHKRLIRERINVHTQGATSAGAPQR